MDCLFDSRKFWAVGCFVITISGCASIPREASYVSLKVTEGIQRIQAENEKIVKTLADTQRAILDEEWDTIYSSTEKRYMEKHDITDPARFTQNDRQKIAATAALAREEILNEITRRENALLEKSRANSTAVVEMNDEIVKYLNTLKNIKETRGRVDEILKKVIGYDSQTLQNAVNDKLKSLEGNHDGGQ